MQLPLSAGAVYNSRVAKRLCYIHIGPYKTGTSAIQSFLLQNRSELLKHGYLVPGSGTARGAHHPLARKLCGHPLPQHRESIAVKFARQLANTPAEAVIISSEALAALFQHHEYTKTFFTRIAELNLEPKLLIFPRHQPQWINSRYTEAAQSCSVSESFENFAYDAAQLASSKYSPFLELAHAYNVPLIARPFTTQTMANGAIPVFLEAIGLEPSHFENTNLRRNQGVGPFTVAAGRSIACALVRAGKQLKWRQASRCKSQLAIYLDKRGLSDRGYSGLTTEVARRVEIRCQADNDRFAQRAWNTGWNEIFAADVGREFTPNDFDLCPPDETTRRLLERTLGELGPVVDQILSDPTLAIDEPWNDLQQRAGWMRAGPTQDPSAQPTGTL